MTKCTSLLRSTILASCIATGAYAACPQAPEHLIIRSEFGDPDLHNIHIHDIWAIWYNPDYVSKNEAEFVASRLEEVRCVSLTEYGMQDPPTSSAGQYVNIYIHEPEEDDGFDDEWGNGVGTDDFDMPFMTLPIDAHLDASNVDHEGFHIFQYNSDAPGFEYTGDSAWYIEATANWFAVQRQPDDEFGYIGVGAISGNPHLALWHSWDNARSGDPIHWMTEMRQYALHLFLQHLTDTTDLPRDAITSGFFGGTKMSPQEYLVGHIGYDQMATSWADFAALLTASTIHGSESSLPKWALNREQRDEAVQERIWIMEDEYINGVENDIAITIDLARDLGVKKSPPAKLLPRPWSYNVGQLLNGAGTYQITLDTHASDEMQMRLVVLQNGVWTIKPVLKGGKVTLEQNETAYIIFSYAPHRFTGSEPQPYHLRFDEI